MHFIHVFNFSNICQSTRQLYTLPNCFVTQWNLLNCIWHHALSKHWGRWGEAFIGNDCSLFFFLIKKFFLFYLWLRWVFVALRELSLVAVSGGYSSLRCAGFSLRRLLLLWNTCSRHAGFSSCGVRASVVVAHRVSCSKACGIFSDQGSNLCPLHWQADSYLLCHQGSPCSFYWINVLKCVVYQCLLYESPKRYFC